MFNTRVLQIAAIDEEIEECERELEVHFFTGTQYEWTLKLDSMDRLKSCLVRKLKLSKLKSEVKRPKFVELGYLDEFIDIKKEIVDLRLSLNINDGEFNDLKSQAVSEAKSSPDIPMDKESDYKKNSNCVYDSDSDGQKENLRD
jgi:hypothetical protein